MPTSSLLPITKAPLVKFVPVNVTFTLVPCAPLLGVIELRVGAGGTTLNGLVPLVPPPSVTVTFAAPSAALPAMVKVAVIWVELTTTMFVTVTPGLETAIEAGEKKLLPDRVTGTLVPCEPELGLTEV